MEMDGEMDEPSQTGQASISLVSDKVDRLFLRSSSECVALLPPLPLLLLLFDALSPDRHCQPLRR